MDGDETGTSIFAEMRSEKVKLLIDVLGLQSTLWCSSDLQCTRVVFKDFAMCSGRAGCDRKAEILHFAKNLDQVDSRANAHAQGNKFAFRSREHDLCDEIGGPKQGAAAVHQNKTSTRTGSARIELGNLLVPISGKI